MHNMFILNIYIIISKIILCIIFVLFQILEYINIFFLLIYILKI